MVLRLTCLSAAPICSLSSSRLRAAGAQGLCWVLGMSLMRGPWSSPSGSLWSFREADYNNYGVSGSCFSSASYECVRGRGGGRLGSLWASSFSFWEVRRWLLGWCPLESACLCPRPCVPSSWRLRRMHLWVGGLWRQERQGALSKETHLEPAVKDDDSGPSRTWLLLLAVMTHSGTWQFLQDLSSYLWNFSTDLLALSRAGCDKAVKFCLCPYNILFLPELSPKWALLGYLSSMSDWAWSRKGELRRMIPGFTYREVWTHQIRKVFSPLHHGLEVICRLRSGWFSSSFLGSLIHFALCQVFVSPPCTFLSWKRIWQNG